jgi:phosphoglycolate phosphatase
MSVPPLLIFDLDGTLVDSLPDLAATLNTLLKCEGLEPLDLENVRPMVGKGARVLLQKGFEANGRPLSANRLEELFLDFLVYYGDNIAKHTEPFPHVCEAIDQLAEDGWRFAICTNKTEALARKLLDTLDLAWRFKTIVGADTFDVRKPHPGHILQTIKLSGGHPERSIMVGDSISDVRAAKDANIPVIGVTFGYTDIPMQQLEPDVLLDSYRELIAGVRCISSFFDRV